MDWLANLITVAGGGVALWLVVGLIIKAYPPLDQNPDAKFYLAFVLAFVIPVGAYLIEIWLGYATWSAMGFFFAVGVGYTISQSVHRTTEKLLGDTHAVPPNKDTFVP